MLIKKTPGWWLPEREATPEASFLSRRQFLRSLALGSIGGGLLLSGCVSPEEKKAQVQEALRTGNLQSFQVLRNPKYAIDRPVTDELVAATYNNFYEFSGGKEVWRHVDNFQPHPWTLEIAGLVRQPQTLALEDLLSRIPLEERLYRHRCVEAWAMAVPWIGFPLKTLIERVEPLSAARFVKMVTFMRPKEVPRQDLQNYPWPYTEGLTMGEATNELAFLAVGIYGHELPKQHGAPIRLVVPWKYGFKSIKSIARIEFTDVRPSTFWNTLVASEYDFEANVNPFVPHPRWSQATERMLGTGDRRPTQHYNGYGEYVANLYS